MAEDKLHHGTFKSKDGTRLHFRAIPNPEAKAVLLFVHGYGEHSARYDEIMRWFSSADYDVASFDYRGHGQAEGRRGHVQKFEQYMDDLDAFIRWALGRSSDDRKVYLVGHSNGGLLVAHYVLNQPEGIDGVALSAPLMGFKLKIPAWKSLLGKGMSVVWPTLSLPSDIPAVHLSHDPEIVKAYEADPLVNHNATARWFTETIQAQETVLTQADRIQLPVLLMQGAEDLIVDPEASERFFTAVGATDKELKWYDGLYHELFNELKKEEIFNDVKTWLDKH